MKKYLIALLLLTACGKKEETTVLAPKEFEEKFQQTPAAVLLDVRRPEEVETETLAQAEHIVFDEAFANKLDTLKNTPLFVYCAGGKRSAKAAKILRDKGYTQVYELKGGLNEWKAEGLPLVKGPSVSR